MTEVCVVSHQLIPQPKALTEAPHNATEFSNNFAQNEEVASVHIYRIYLLSYMVSTLDESIRCNARFESVTFG